MLTREQLIAALRLYGDVASAGDKGHWGLVMREAAAMLLSDAAALKMMSTWARDETIPTVEALRDVERALHGWHNAKSERLDRVRSTDGLCVNGSEVGAGKTAVQVYLLPANNNVSGAL